MKTSSASKADKFAGLFDQDWKTAKSTIRVKAENNRCYDPMYSWDAKADNPTEFSRLQATFLPQQPSKPITLSGSAVVVLEHTPGLTALNVKPPEKSKSSIPLTVEQQDVGMTSDLRARVPSYEEAKQQGRALLMVEQPVFKNGNLQAPKFSQKEVPSFIREAGSQADQRLLTPAQRRELLVFEKQQKEAEKAVRAAQSARLRTKVQITGMNFRRGVLMVDSNDNVNSEVYGETAKEQQRKNEIAYNNERERAEKLARRTSSQSVVGNILVPETVSSSVRIDKYFQSKGGDHHGLSFNQTHDRIFNRCDKVFNPSRTQLLRDTELSGKPYNIVNHTLIEAYPPRKFERLENKVLAHPSQTSLEGTRNLQGSLRPF